MRREQRDMGKWIDRAGKERIKPGRGGARAGGREGHPWPLVIIAVGLRDGLKAFSCVLHICTHGLPPRASQSRTTVTV